MLFSNLFIAVFQTAIVGFGVTQGDALGYCNFSPSGYLGANCHVETDKQTTY